MQNQLTTLLCCLGAGFVFGPSVVSAEDWPQWRGPSRDCRISETSPTPDQAWPKNLDSEHLTKLWQIPLGPSYSGPIVVGSRVFVTETRDESDEVVRALDRNTGAELWKVEWAGAIEVPFFARENGSWIRSTPACDGERLFVAGIRDVLVCLNVETGEEIWRVDLVNQFDASLPGFGTVCSPLLDGEFVYLQAAASITKIRKSDGEVVWRSKPESGGLFGAGMGASAFSSPVIATLGQQRQLVVQSRERLFAVNLETGEELWTVEVPAFRGMNILTPLVIGDSIFTSSYGGGAFLFDVTQTDGTFQVTERWTNNKQAYMSSPVLIGDQIYLHLRNQRFSCMDPASGETSWTTKPLGKYWSMAVNGNQILALNQTGELRLIQAASGDYQEASQRTITDESTWAHLAVSENQIFVREQNSISAWNWK